MAQLGNLLDFQIMIFLIMLTGYLARKIGLLPAEAGPGLTNLLLYVTLPCNILSSFLSGISADILKSCGVVLVISALLQLFCELFSRVAYRGLPRERQTVLKYATLCPNAGFLGFPLAEGLYGQPGLLYASIYLIPQTAVMWSWGLACFTGVSDGKTALKKTLTHPCMIATLLGVLLMLSGIALPRPLIRTVDMVSGATTPLTLLVIGGVLAEIDFRTVLRRWVAFFCAIRLLLLPGLVLLCCRLLNIDPLVSAVCAVLTGTPAGATTAILAEKYGCEPEFAVKCVFLSTALSLLTIPLLSIVAELVF